MLFPILALPMLHETKHSRIAGSESLWMRRTSLPLGRSTVKANRWSGQCWTSLVSECKLVAGVNTRIGPGTPLGPPPSAVDIHTGNRNGVPGPRPRHFNVGSRTASLVLC
jgi:hypothetical protein